MPVKQEQPPVVDARVVAAEFQQPDDFSDVVSDVSMGQPPRTVQFYDITGDTDDDMEDAHESEPDDGSDTEPLEWQEELLDTDDEESDPDQW